MTGHIFVLFTKNYSGNIKMRTPDDEQDDLDVLDDEDLELEESRPMDRDLNKLKEIYNTLPKHKRAEALTLLEDFAKQARREPPPLPEPNGKYKRYIPHSGIDPLKLLEDQWGPWLKAYNNDRDYMGQKELRERDEKLYYALRYQLKTNSKTSEISLKSIVPNKSVLIDQEAENITEKDIKKAKKVRSILISRDIA